jgi:hypothetical protein
MIAVGEWCMNTEMQGVDRTLGLGGACTYHCAVKLDAVVWAETPAVPEVCRNGHGR